MLILMFVAYTVFCAWGVFMGGAETHEGGKSPVLFDWFAATLTARELRFYVAISWLAAPAGLLFWRVGRHLSP